ncbi:hypothetical protein JKP88DRAFT_264538 [Tribonema minus]|uniref:Cyclin N-terminal domain-containing protein n=1 Tax=Tribonema minus TaxID=303371 RepID=A0A835YNR4_9STRA|nr:hypothetical protein JKP88DRAFT_264538 [Tribonema minus]
MTTKKLVQDLDAQLSHEENLAQDALPNVRKVYVKSLETGDAADLNLKFSLSLLLIKSAKRRDNEEGLELLSELVAAGYHTTDCYYSVALGLYRMGRFEESRTQCEMLLRRIDDPPAGVRSEWMIPVFSLLVKSTEPRHALEPKLLVPAVCPTDDSDTEENTPSPASPAAGSGGATITSRRGSDKSRGGSSAVQEFRTDFSYEVFTPGPHALGTVQYRAPEKRVPSAVAPPSSVARPNYHDAIRRVAVVVFQHVQNCERRLARVKRAAEHPPRPPPTRAPPHAPFGGGQPGGVSAPLPVTPGAVREAFDPAKADLFHERHYVSPRYRCTFVRALGAAGALPCSAFAMAKVETEPTAPSVEAIYEFIRTLFNRACLSSECSLVCLIYIERLMEVAAVPLLATTWKPVVLCGLLLASKVWQDLSSWNVEFSTVYPEFSLRSINRLEHVYLAQVQWDLYISASLYAKYYFALRSLAEGRDFRRRYNCVVQIDAPRADRVQERSLAVREEAAKMFSKSL